MQFRYFQENTDKGILFEMSSSALHLTGIFGLLARFPRTPILRRRKGREAIRGKARDEYQEWSSDPQHKRGFRGGYVFSY